MTTEPVRQTLFTAGQIDQVNWKRTELPEYLAAAQSLLNMVVTTTGGIKKRLGTDFLQDVTNPSINPADPEPSFNAQSRMYPIQDNFNNFYIIIGNDANFYIYSVNFSVSPIQILIYQKLTGLPYPNADIPAIDYCNNNDTLVLTHPNHIPGRIYATSYTAGRPTWAYQPFFTGVLSGPLLPLPSYDFGNINYSGYTAALVYTPSTNVYDLTLTNPGGGATGFTTDWVGGEITGLGLSTSDNLLLGSGIITSMAFPSGNVVIFSGTVNVPFNTTSPGLTGALYSIKQPAWTAALGYPAKCLFYQNRLWMASTTSLRDTIFGSAINQPLNFSVGVGADTDAIIYDIGESDSGSILWLNGGKQLEIYCDNFEFSAPQELNVALTPSTFSVRQQSSYGSSPNMKPLTYINNSYFLAKSGQAIMSFSYNGIGQTYTATNVTAGAPSLISGTIKANLIRGDTSQDNFIFFQTYQNFPTNPDGSNVTLAFSCFQFAPEVKLAALTPVVFDQTVTIFASCVVNNTLFMLKNLLLSQIVCIEAMVPQTSSTTPIKMDSLHECDIDATGLVTGNPQLNNYSARLVIQGQDFGESMQLVAGQLIPGVVTNGSCYFTPQPDTIGTAQIGIAMFDELIPMYTWAGALQTNYFKQITNVFVDYYNSIDFAINGITVPYQTYSQIQQQPFPMTPQTGTAEASPMLGWEREQTFIISQHSPFDLQIVGMTYQVDKQII